MWIVIVVAIHACDKCAQRGDFNVKIRHSPFETKELAEEWAKKNVEVRHYDKKDQTQDYFVREIPENDSNSDEDSDEDSDSE